MITRLFAMAGMVCAVILGFCGPASARTVTIEHGGTFVGKDVIVAHDQVIDGDVTVFFGDLIIEGTVNGNVSDVGGNIDQRPGSTVRGKVNAVSGDYVSSIAPWAASGTSAVLEENSRMMARLMYGVVIVLVFLIFPVRVRVALDRLEHHPGLSAAVGLVAIIPILALMVLLAASIIGIPLIPVECAAVIAGVFIGQAALGMLVGRRLFELIRPHTTPSPIAALILGLFFISAAEIIPVIGGVVTVLVVLVGLGAAALALIGDSSLRPPRPTISGPPMKPA